MTIITNLRTIIKIKTKKNLTLPMMINKYKTYKKSLNQKIFQKTKNTMNKFQTFH
jgi:hypothetical protein